MTIWKFCLDAAREQAVEMPQGAKILSAGLDPAGSVCVWAAVDPWAPRVPRTLWVVGTGQNLPPGESSFVGTVHQGIYVWHVFEGQKGAA